MTMREQVRIRVIAPFVLMLVVFLLGFPVWQRSPHSLGGRLFAYFFGTVIVTFAINHILGMIGEGILGYYWPLSAFRKPLRDFQNRKPPDR
jgi:hypothetical protein